MIGRDHAARQLRDTLRRTVTSHGGLVLVCGEAGIGKTTLITEVVGEMDADTALVLTATAWNGEGTPGFWPWVQVLRGLRRAAGPRGWAALDDAAGNALSVLIGEAPAREDDANLFRIGDAVTEALVAACAVRPVIVVIDDLHRADPASVRLLAFVARHTWFERLAIVAAVRDGEVATPQHPLAEAFAQVRDGARVLELTGLGVDALGEIAWAATGQRLPGEVLETLHAITGGNPFVAEQAARLWGAGDALDSLDSGVRHILDARLTMLPTAVVEVLTTAALLGGEFDSAVLESVAAAPVDLATAVRARLVGPVTPDRYRFVHDLIREALTNRIGPREARQRHAALATALLDARGSPGDIAHHAYLAHGEIDARQRIHLLLTAARDARARLAANEAAQHYRRALELLGDHDDQHAEVTLALAVTLTDTGELADAREAFEATLGDAERTGRADLFAEAALGLHELGTPDPEFDADREIALMDRAHRLLLTSRPETDPLAVRLLAAAQRVRVHTGRSRTPDPGGDDAEIVELARKSGDDTAMAAALLARHDMIWWPGTAADRLALANELVAVGQRSRREEIHLQGGLLRYAALLELGDPRAHAELAAFTMLADRSRLPRFRFVALSRVGALAMLTGQFAEARAAIDGAYTLGERLGEVDRNPLWLEQRWALAVLTGDADEAAAFVDRYYTMAGEYTAVPDLVTAVLRGDVERVRLRFSDSQRLYETYPRHFQPGILVAQAQAALALDDPALRDSVRAKLLPLRDYWAVVAGGGAVYGPYAYWLGRLAAAAGEHGLAAAELRSAAEAARRLRARPWVDAAEHHLRLLGHVHPPPIAPEAAVSVPDNAFRRDGAVWTVRFADRTAHLPDAKGLRDLHLLLSHPGHDIPALELVGGPGEPTVRAARSFGAEPVLDETAKKAYRQRLTALDEQIDRATALGADDRAAELDRERAALLSELRSATGLAGRTRKLGDEAERARKTVSARVRDTLRRLDRQHPELAEHLRANISLGLVCRYHPHRAMRWAL
ncbi:ATP-binding protein [Nocardia transvalensis]|uniref:ATP-binding protein n=1 Tax=Nocardia transvalensis TaxID=37333 RepID=UPI0018940894|nr:AAA family ATPase [Nocardia transvalensis]MBF6328848.1 AAA family ATPase [Nocardia transvalensis]